MTYSDDDMLMLSGIQHFRFCPRQWALIHIDQQWDDNRLTMEGSLMHQHADDPFYRQKCGDYISLRSVSVASHQLGLYGVTDVVELHPVDNENGISHPRYPGWWLPYLVEYKHGKPKKHEEDEVQFVTLKSKIAAIMNMELDSIRFYFLSSKSHGRVMFLGKVTSYDVSEAIII